MFCKRCGTQIPDDAAICPECGTATATPQTPDGTVYKRSMRGFYYKSNTPDVPSTPRTPSTPKMLGAAAAAFALAMIAFITGIVFFAFLFTFEGAFVLVYVLGASTILPALVGFGLGIFVSVAAKGQFGARALAICACVFTAIVLFLLFVGGCVIVSALEYVPYL